MSVRALEDKLKKLSKEQEDAPIQHKQQELPDDYYKVLEHMGKYFGNNISLKRTAAGKGTMTVRFDSDQEMFNFLKALEESGL